MILLGVVGGSASCNRAPAQGSARSPINYSLRVLEHFGSHSIRGFSIWWGLVNFY